MKRDVAPVRTMASYYTLLRTIQLYLVDTIIVINNFFFRALLTESSYTHNSHAEKIQEKMYENVKQRPAFQCE